MRSFNLSRWALEHPALTRYLMVVLMVLGVAAYFVIAPMLDDLQELEQVMELPEG